MRRLASLAFIVVLAGVLDLSEATASPVSRLARAVIKKRLGTYRNEFRADLENLLAKYEAPQPHRSDDQIFPEWKSLTPTVFILDHLLANQPEAEACRLAAIIISLIADPMSAEQREMLACELFRRALGRQLHGIVPLCLHLLEQIRPSERVYGVFVSSLHIKEARRVFKSIVE